MVYRIEQNSEYQSNEVYFDGKPAQEVIDALKNLGMRWHHLRRCWYGRKSESEIKNAILATNGNKCAEDGATVTTPGYMGGGAYYGAKSNKRLWGAELSAAIRGELKRAGITGASVKNKTFSGGQEITLTIKFSLSDVIPFEQFASGYEIHGGGWIYYIDENGKEQCLWHEEYYNMNREEREQIRRQAARREWERETQREMTSCGGSGLFDCKGFSPAFLEKLKRAYNIAEAYNYDESNSMVDYFDCGFYLQITTKPTAA